MYKITAHLGRRDLQVWHLPEQDCDIVMCHFSRLHYTNIRYIIVHKCGRFSRFLGISRDFPLIFPQKWTP
jgi:hypothetical protein